VPSPECRPCTARASRSSAQQKKIPHRSTRGARTAAVRQSSARRRAARRSGGSSLSVRCALLRRNPPLPAAGPGLAAVVSSTRFGTPEHRFTRRCTRFVRGRTASYAIPGLSAPFPLPRCDGCRRTVNVPVPLARLTPGGWRGRRSPSMSCCSARRTRRPSLRCVARLRRVDHTSYRGHFLP
jgi:hypothetical protein